MPTAPTLVAFAVAETTAASGVAVTTGSISWQTGDVVVVFVGTTGESGGETIATPTTTGSGISFGTAQQQHNSTGSDCGGGCWAAVTTASSSGTFSSTITYTGGAGDRYHSTAVYIFRGSAGIGNSVLYTGTSPAGASLTPTGADGSICWLVADWNADTVQTITPTPTTHGTSTPGPQASPFSAQHALLYTSYVAELDDQTSAGAVSYGLSTANTGPFTILAFEAKAMAGGTDATVVPPARVDVLIH